MQLRGSTVLVTGATGFTGSFVAARLVREGAQVRALVRKPDANVPGATLAVGDLRDPQSVTPHLEGVDAVVHCAIAYRLPIEDARTLSVEGTRALAEAALAAGCERFVHVSTVSVYDTRYVDTVDEDTPFFGPDLATTGPYNVSKAEAERALAAVAANGLPTVVLRPPAILGPHPRCSWTFDMAARIARGALGYGGDGSERLPFVYVENLVDAVVLSITNDAAVGGSFNVVDGEVPWRSYLERLAAIVDRPLAMGPGVPDYALDEMRKRFLASRIRERIGYRPRVEYDEAMERIGDFLTAHLTPGSAPLA